LAELLTGFLWKDFESAAGSEDKKKHALEFSQSVAVVIGTTNFDKGTRFTALRADFPSTVSSCNTRHLPSQDGLAEPILVGMV